jgi:hypothetical protein
MQEMLTIYFHFVSITHLFNTTKWLTTAHSEFTQICARARVAEWARLLDYLTTHTSLSQIRRGFSHGFVNYKKRCTRLATDKIYQLLAHGRWFSPASSTTKPGRHDIAESGVKHQKSNQICASTNITCITDI